MNRKVCAFARERASRMRGIGRIHPRRENAGPPPGPGPARPAHDDAAGRLDAVRRRAVKARDYGATTLAPPRAACHCRAIVVK